MSALVQVEHLSVDYGWKHPVHAVRDVTLSIQANEFVGLVGESGCGKSTLGFALAHLLKSPAHKVGGRIVIAGQDWDALTPEEVRRARWQEVAVVLQSGMNALNPIMTVEAQFRDVLEQHTDLSRQAIHERAETLMGMVQIRPEVLRRYPHELSGGMKQRVAIALAMALNPKLVIMDEPTTALDVVVQRQILENLRILREHHEFAVLFISHDLGLVMEVADTVMVMYAGEIVERQASSRMLTRPMHPYTRALMDSLPDPEHPTGVYGGIPGNPPDLHVIPQACMFAARCTLRDTVCGERAPDLEHFPELDLRCFVTRREVVA
jgi:oligopeptide/dipeptide ABC transporter ATP-binding protein